MVVKGLARKYLSGITNRLSMSETDVQLKKLRKLPRFTDTEFYLFHVGIKIPDGASFLFMYSEIFVKQIYKFQTCSKSPYIIDAGANIGLASIYFKKLYPKAEIVAFEPDPLIFNYLKYNIKEYGFENILLLQKGLWNRDTKLKFNQEGADAGKIDFKNDESLDGEFIEVISLKPFLRRKVDLLKIDIEGAEIKVLEDISGSLHFVERIFIEYHSFTNEVQTLGKIVQILEDAEFRYHINSPGLTSEQPFVIRNEYNGMDMQLNIYGFKN